MVRNRRRETTVSVVVIAVDLGIESPDSITCLSCNTLLEIHQPESGFPDRMLGTCHHCHSWYLWDFDSQTNQAVMVQLPDQGYFQKAAWRDARPRCYPGEPP